MASSNLRRAVSTGMIALSARLLQNEDAPSTGGHKQEQIYVMSALQVIDVSMGVGRDEGLRR